MAVVSLKGVSTGFEPLPQGFYEVTCTKAEARTSKSGQPAFRLTLTVDEGEQHGRQVFYNGSLQAHALFGFKRALAALDPKSKWLESEAVDTDEALQDMQGQSGKIAVTEVTLDNGRPGNNVNFVLPGETMGWDE